MYHRKLSRSKKWYNFGSSFITIVTSFLAGCVVCTSIYLYLGLNNKSLPVHEGTDRRTKMIQFSENNKESNLTGLNGLKILVAITAFDFNQIPHLEEVLDSYRDSCEAGAKVDVFIYTAAIYPVVLIDLLNSRLKCVNPSPQSGFSITISVKSPRLRLHMVDCHRKLFYDKIEDYDLFVYTEDDIRVTPSVLASYMHETQKVIDLVGKENLSNYNVGIVRYEYNYPPDVVIEDKTRHATANVTRVYWEHLGRPIFTKVSDVVPDEKLASRYIYMKNNHQGMFLATKQQLKDWKVRPNCKFDVIRDRPGMIKNPAQHTEGTQRVWMSSNMLLGKKHCAVQQLLPIDSFESLTVLHLPNKNYRRVGKQGRIGGIGKENAPPNPFSDGSEKFAAPDASLITELEFHIALREKFPIEEKEEYDGIIMVDEIFVGVTSGVSSEFQRLVRNNMDKYNAYVSRGGVLDVLDMPSYFLHDYIDIEKKN